MLRPPSRRARGRAAASTAAEAAADAAAAAVVGGTGAVVPTLPTPPAPATGRVCIPCRLTRVRCDLNVPCERCFRLCIQCKQPGRRRYTPRRSAGTSHDAQAEAAGEDEEEEEEQISAADNSSNTGATRKGPRKRGRERAAKSPSLDAKPMNDLIIARTDPRAAASLYRKGFERLLQEGRIIRERVLAMVRVWWVLSLAAGADVTWGLLGAFTQALDINLVEVEGRDAVRWGTSAEQRAQRAHRQLEGMGRVSKSLEELSAFRQADDGVVPMLLFAFGGPPLKGEETAWAEDEAAVCLQAHNGPMRSLLQSAASPTQGAMQFKTIQVLKTHGFFAPGDGERYLLRVQEMLFTDTRSTTDIIKASFGDGNVRLYIVRARRIEVEDEGQGSRVYLLHHIEPCPASKHVTDMPDSFKMRTIKYHKPYQPSSTQVLLRQSPASSAASSVDSASFPTSASASTKSNAGAASGPLPMHIPGLAAIPSLTPAAAAAATAGALPTSSTEAAVGPAGLFGVGNARRSIEAAAAAGCGSVMEEAKDDGHEQSPLLAPALLMDDAAALDHQSSAPQLHLLHAPAPRSSPSTTPLAWRSPHLSPSLSASVASSLSEQLVVDPGAGGRVVGYGDELGTRRLPAVPVFDEAGMQAIFD